MSKPVDVKLIKHLEYSDTQGYFHNNYGEEVENTNGWSTIANDVVPTQADMFRAFVESRYRFIPFKISNKQMIAEWEIFDRYIKILIGHVSRSIL